LNFSLEKATASIQTHLLIQSFTLNINRLLLVVY